MGGNPFFALMKKRKGLTVSIAVMLMVATWGISYYIFLSQGNSSYISKSQEVMGKVSQINSQLEILTGKTDFLDGTSSSELRNFVDVSSKDILNMQGQFSALKYTPGYNAQARNIREIFNQEGSALNIISQVTERPLDYGNTKRMDELKGMVSKIQSLSYQIDMPNLNKSGSLEGMFKNLGIFLESKVRNSMSEAYKIAQGELGGNIIQVAPFAFDNKNFIAVRRSADQDNSSCNVIILQSQGSDYVEVWRNQGSLPITSGDLQTKLFTAQDVDGDDNPDVTYFNQASGTAGSGATLTVYSVANSTEYSVTVTQSAYYTKGSRQQIQVSDNLKLTQNKVIYDWIKNTLTQNQIIKPEITDEDMLNDPNLAGDLWYRENVDLHGNGKIKTHWYNGDAPNKSTVTAEVRDGSMVYRSYFKDGVYAIDTQNNKFYVVYIPESQYDWIEKLELGDNGLVMHTREADDQPSTTYFYNPDTQQLSKGQ